MPVLREAVHVTLSLVHHGYSSGVHSVLGRKENRLSRAEAEEEQVAHERRRRPLDNRGSSDLDPCEYAGQARGAGGVRGLATPSLRLYDLMVGSLGRGKLVFICRRRRC